MENNEDAYGNRGEYILKDKLEKIMDVKKRGPRKHSLVKTLIILGAISLLPFGAFVINEYHNSLPRVHAKTADEYLIEARQIYERALQNHADHQTLNGTEAVIRALENRESF